VEFQDRAAEAPEDESLIIQVPAGPLMVTVGDTPVEDSDFPAGEVTSRVFVPEPDPCTVSVAGPAHVASSDSEDGAGGTTTVVVGTGDDVVGGGSLMMIVGGGVVVVVVGGGVVVVVVGGGVVIGAGIVVGVGVGWCAVTGRSGAWLAARCR
jgi:hypothetical protein